jgi:hypothetical protein
MIMASKKTKKTSAKMSKTDFIRQFDRAVPAKEVIEKGEKAGIDLTANFIYAVRSADSRPKSGRPVGRPPKGSPVKAGEISTIPEVVTTTPAAPTKKGLARAGTAPSTAAAIDLVLRLGTDGAHKAIDEVVRGVEQLRLNVG